MQRQLRQGWQSDAWSYRDSIGELRYAVNFLANCTARMRVYPAVYPIGGEADHPVAMEHADGVPERLISLAAQAIQDLGNGRMAISGLLHGLSTNKSIAGEAWLLGRTDEQTRQERWSVRSVDELVVYNDQWHLRETPDARQSGAIPWIELKPELNVISRIWTPHPRFQLLADSPLKAMLDDCESLMILRRGIRAVGRSRLASRGLLLVPDELSIKVPIDDDADPEADPFMGALTQAMMAPMVNEGTADGAVPIVIRGPSEQLDKLRVVDLASKFDEQAPKTREELIGIIATTLDLPREVVMGIADLNHWSAWQVDDNTFRHHVEPHVISCCDDLSSGYLRPYLTAAGVEDFWTQRSVLWYDPVELVTHPDRTADAKDAYAAMAISGRAYRDAAGFSDDDAPTIEELEARRLWDIRALPLNLLMEYARRADPSLLVPPITVSGTVPGIKAGGVDIGAPQPVAHVADGPSTAPVDGPSPASPVEATAPGPPPTDRPAPSPITAAGKSATHARRLSRRLASIDSSLRARLQVAANAALLRALERAGARLRTKVARDETLRAKIAHRANERVPALLGPQVLAAAGLTTDDLLGGAWSGLRVQYEQWTAAAQKQVLAAAAQIATVQISAKRLSAAQAQMDADRDAGWTLLENALQARSQHLLHNPDPNSGPGDWGELNPDTLLPAGTIRASLARAGGATATFAPDETGNVALLDPVGQIGTGATISDLLSGAGAERQGYEWIHGPSLHPLEAHEALDGVQFESFDDDQLINPDDWPQNQYLMPGDHDGCLCDFMPLWMGSESEE